jgi:hypothetical protein
MVMRRGRTMEPSISFSCDLGISLELKEYPMTGGGGNVYITQDSSLSTTTMKNGFHAKNVCAHYLIRALVSYTAHKGNGRHLFAVATKRVSKNFIF